MNTFLLITNDGKDKDLTITKKISDFLVSKGKTVYLCEKDQKKRIIRESIPDSVQCAIVLGGDGTFMEAARELYGLNILLLGINLGTVGFLTEVEISDLDNTLERLVNHAYSVDRRMMLDTYSSKGIQKIALNDVAITRRGPLAIRFSIYVNGILLNQYDADGMVISSPTGSTAYNLSAGGPIVEPTASLILLTPICPHTLGSASIVLSSEDKIEVVLEKCKNGSDSNADITFDGRDMIHLKSGDSFVVTKAPLDCKIIRFSNRSFVEIVREKMKGN